MTWEPLKRTDPRSEAAVEAIRAEWRKRMAAAGKPFGGTPAVNDRKISADGTRVRGNIVIPTKRGRNASTWGDEMRGVEADMLPTDVDIPNFVQSHEIEGLPEEPSA